MLFDQLGDARMIVPRVVGVICGQGPVSKAREAASTARSTSTCGGAISEQNGNVNGRAFSANYLISGGDVLGAG